jgi:hypothetical protein
MRRHIVSDMLLGGSRQRGYEGMKKYFETLERMEQFEPKSGHILLITHKGNCRLNVTVAPLGAEL